MNLDKLGLMPNQQIDGDFSECVGISVADVVGNIVGFPCDPDFSYAAGFNVAGETPSTAGEEPRAGIDGAIAFGVLPASEETFTALSNGELWVANYQNYPANQRQDALKYAQNGAQALYTFDDIWNWLQKQESGAIIPIQFYQTFNVPDPQGFLPQPGGQSSAHCIAAYDTGVTNGLRYLVVKMWIGKNYGVGGYVNMTEGIFNKVFLSPAYRFEPTASRFVSLLVITARRFPWFLSYIPQIISDNLKKKTP